MKRFWFYQKYFSQTSVKEASLLSAQPHFVMGQAKLNTLGKALILKSVFIPSCSPLSSIEGWAVIHLLQEVSAV